jgi:mycothione reductase
VHLRLKQQIVGFEMTDRDTVIVESVDAKGIHYDFECERVLVALGRIPNGDLLNLAATGVETHPDGRVKVDEYQQTTVKGIFALGDMSSAAQLKHVANHEARVVQHNLLHPRRMIAADHRFIPHAVFSDPQVASVGLTEAEAKERGKPYVTARQNYGDVAYGWAMEDTDHFVKLIADPKTKRLLGAHLLGPEATTLIQPLIQAMSFDLDVPSMARGQYWIHPALTEVVENALLGLKL